MLWLLGLAFTLLRGKWMPLLGSDLFGFDLVTILTAYIFCLYGKTPAGLFAFGEGFVIDLFSGGLHGLFTSLSLTAFGGIYLGSLFFNVQNPKAQFVIISLTVLLKKMIFLLLLEMFDGVTAIHGKSLWAVGVSVLASGTGGTILFYLLDRLKPAALRGRQEVSSGAF